MYVRIKKGEIKEGKFQKMVQYKKIMEEKMKKKKFTQEFKQDTIDYYHSSGKSIREVSKKIDIKSLTLSIL